jgi:hypothetical protein
MTNSLVRISRVEGGDLIKRALSAKSGRNRGQEKKKKKACKISSDSSQISSESNRVLLESLLRFIRLRGILGTKSRDHCSVGQ